MGQMLVGWIASFVMDQPSARMYCTKTPLMPAQESRGVNYQITWYDHFAPTQMEVQ